MSFEVLLLDESAERIDEADTYRQEGPLTTFFRTGPGRTVVDAWSERIASFRTTEIRRIRRVDEAPAGRLRAVE
ncbi:MAG: hypothetical protein IPM45_00795 [Acidimicrobiales bacterium]|nr:hypothetical protein [Acidimicrobiales bacterium]